MKGAFTECYLNRTDGALDHLLVLWPTNIIVDLVEDKQPKGTLTGTHLSDRHLSLSQLKCHASGKSEMNVLGFLYVSKWNAFM